jgi:hypothetical protein
MTVLAAMPLPAIPINGTTDGAGNTTIAFTAPAHFYALCYIAVQAASGAPAYAVQTGIGQPLTFGAGGQANLGPFLLNPGQQAQLVVTGATPATQISGQVLGIQALDPEGLVTALPVQSTTVTVTGPVAISGAVTITSGSVTVSGAVTVSGSVSISSGTVAVSGTVTVAGSVAITSGTVSISGTVNIAGSVSITSGTVNISGTPNINISSQSVVIGTNQPQTLLTSGSVAAGATATIGNQTLPAGTHAVQVNLSRAQNIQDATQILGTQTGDLLIGLAGAPAGAINGLVSSVADIQVQGAIVNTNGALAISWWLSAVLDATVLYPVQIMPVGALVVAGGPQYVDVIGGYVVDGTQAIKAATFTRVPSSATGSPHFALDTAEAGPVSVVAFDASIAAAAVSVQVAAVGGAWVKLYDVLLGGAGAATFWLENTAGVVQGVFIQGGIGAFYPYHRRTLGSGLGVQIRNTDAAARNARGMIGYTQDLFLG